MDETRNDENVVEVTIFIVSRRNSRPVDHVTLTWLSFNKTHACHIVHAVT